MIADASQTKQLKQNVSKRSEFKGASKSDNARHYLSLVADWHDPHPAPEIETHDLVWNTVVSILGRSHRFKEEIKRQVFPDGSPPNSTEEVSRLNKAKKKLAAEIAEVTNSIVTLETDKILKKRSTHEVERIIEEVEKFRMELQAKQDAIDEEIASLQSKSRWVDWLQKFSERVSKFSDFSPEERHDFLQGILKRIQVFTEDKQQHRLRLEFVVPYVDDSLTWTNGKDGKKRYEISDGKQSEEVLLPSKK